MPLDRTAARVLLAALLLAGCSAPANVTDTAGQPGQSAAQQPQASAPGSTASPDLLAKLPPCQSTPPLPSVPDGLPDVELLCLGPGGPIALTGLRGPLIVNTWASWCAPCRSELPALASFAENAAQEVAVLGLNVSDDPAAAADLWAKLLMPFPSLTDQQAATRPGLGWIGLPVTYFVDEQGAVVARHDGAVTDETEWRELAQQHLGVS